MRRLLNPIVGKLLTPPHPALVDLAGWVIAPDKILDARRNLSAQPLRQPTFQGEGRRHLRWEALAALRLLRLPARHGGSLFMSGF